MEFIEAPAFTRHLSKYLDDDQYRTLQARLAANPKLGDLMPGTGGFRKMRWVAEQGAKGRVADYLLPLSVRLPDMADDSLR
jgi:hypothetical protein